MRYLNLDLEVLQKWEGLKPAHLFLFGYIKRLCESKSAKIQARRVEGWTWVDYGALLEDLPCLRLGYEGMKDAADTLVRSGLVERVTRNYQKARRSYFRIAQAYYDREAELDHAEVKDSQGEKNPFEDSQGLETTLEQGLKSTPVTAPVGLKTTQDRIPYRELKPGEEPSPSLESFPERIAKKAGKPGDRAFMAKISGLLLSHSTAEIEGAVDACMRSTPEKVFYIDADFWKWAPRTPKESPDPPGFLSACNVCGSTYQTARPGGCNYCEDHPPARLHSGGGPGARVERVAAKVPEAIAT